LNVTMGKEDADHAVMLVATQRSEVKGENAAPHVSTQTLEVTLLHVNDTWLVDRATWK